MRVLWLCNQCIPVVAKHLDMNIGNKEGWLSALSEKLIFDNDSNITLGVCFPWDKGHADFKGDYEVTAYAFYEDRVNFHLYDDALEDRFADILDDFKPDVIHIFGTEYSHTLAMCKACSNPSKILIGIQGLISVYARHYFDALPDKIIAKKTLRDALKKDGIKEQFDKYTIRGEHEIEAIKIAGNVTGRTDWDRENVKKINSNAVYYFMNETLRSNFYEGSWNYDSCEKHSIFVSQGDYPIKGLHVALKALTIIKEKYPDVKLYVAGNKINGEDSLKKKILIGEYGKYINELINKNNLKDNVVFTGSLDAKAMKERYLKSNVFLLPSIMENSPNSLGEAMLLKMPIVTSDCGGVRNLLNDDEGYIFPSCDEEKLSEAVIKVFDAKDSEALLKMCDKASTHAKNTHDAAKNLERLKEIYSEIDKN
ncbi:MAG: glycosyltransferase family 4 protein [Lachnospiraceae bacterium]|nr:glycosyltransferase family 4 protein [Lachnospiraceae bacterium]